MNQTLLDQLAQQLVINTLKIQSGEKLWLQWSGDDAAPMALACSKVAKEAGAEVFEHPRGADYENAFLDSQPSDADIAARHAEDLALTKQMDCFIGIGEAGDAKRLKDHGDLSIRYMKAGREVTDHRVENTRWVVSRAPSAAFAQDCNMSLEEFEKFYSDAFLFDYSKMTAPAENLRQLMIDGKDVKIKGQGTDLSFSIEGIGAKSCVGHRNMPDGEVYTAPVKGSVNGHVTFGPSVYHGKSFSEIYLEYKDGKVVVAKSTDDESTKNLNEILDIDEGARYPGEFAIAFNPMIERPVGSILFDEKIKGSYHIASGTCYKNYANNGNFSAVHWDMVQIQTPDHGGGTIEIDGRIIRKDGVFIVPELEGLNPDQLLAD